MGFDGEIFGIGCIVVAKFGIVISASRELRFRNVGFGFWVSIGVSEAGVSMPEMNVNDYGKLGERLMPVVC
jgi:hypothetical protein